jgi:tetratricopeptide (TPR) repeat protein
MSRLDEALADFNALLADDPNYGPALLNRAMLVQERGLYRQALDDLETFLTLPDEDAEYTQVARRTVILLRELVAEIEN